MDFFAIETPVATSDGAGHLNPELQQTVERKFQRRPSREQVAALNLFGGLTLGSSTPTPPTTAAAPATGARSGHVHQSQHVAAVAATLNPRLQQRRSSVELLQAGILKGGLLSWCSAALWFQAPHCWCVRRCSVP